jgi:WD40 repeat protein
MELSPDGNYLASASKKGTLIRIFDTKEKKIISELRRGSKKACLKSLCFTDDNMFLACFSDHGTIHIFNLLGLFKNKSSKLKMFKNIINYFGSQWSFK